MTYYLPSPADMPPVEGINPKHKNAAETRKPDPDEPFCGLVFKIDADKHGDLHYVRVYSGTLKANTRAYNPGKDKKENVPQLWHIQADRREYVCRRDQGRLWRLCAIPIACKPAVLAETDRYVAFGSEYRALTGLPNIDDAKVWEPEPATAYFWGR